MDQNSQQSFSVYENKTNNTILNSFSKNHENLGKTSGKSE